MKLQSPLALSVAALTAAIFFSTCLPALGQTLPTISMVSPSDRSVPVYAGLVLTNPGLPGPSCPLGVRRMPIAP
jgi:hypothetical protein